MVSDKLPKRMKQIRTEAAEICGIEYIESDKDSNTDFIKVQEAKTASLEDIIHSQIKDSNIISNASDYISMCYFNITLANYEKKLIEIKEKLIIIANWIQDNEVLPDNAQKIIEGHKYDTNIYRALICDFITRIKDTKHYQIISNRSKDFAPEVFYFDYLLRLSLTLVNYCEELISILDEINTFKQ